MVSKSSLIILVICSVLLIAAVFLIRKDVLDGADDKELTVERISPYERARQFREEFSYDYYETSRVLENEYPDNKEPLSNSQIKQLFPELWLGQSIACSGKESANFFGDPGNVFSDNLNLNVKGELSPSKDQVAIKIESPTTISFLTAILVESGETEGSKMDILQNDETVLIAQEVSSYGIDTVTVSKKTGLAVWQSTGPGLPMTYEVPHAQTIYMRCLFQDKRF
jgi:hypothetical protein